MLEILDTSRRGLYYTSSVNKGADQLCSYCTADLRLRFRTCRLMVFWRGGSFVTAGNPIDCLFRATRQSNECRNNR